MTVLTASKAREELFPLISKVNTDRDVVRITSRAGNAVLMSEADFEELDTFRHLFSTGINAARLRDSLDRIDRGEYFLVDTAILEDTD